MKPRHPQGNNESPINIHTLERVASAAAGSYLLFNSMTHKSSLRAPKAAIGAVLLYRGILGYSLIKAAMGKSRLPNPAKTINIRTQLVVNKPRHEVYAFWRKLENLPLFMKHLESVEEIDDTYSKWKAKFPGELVSLEWHAQIVKERDGEFIGWSSTSDATVRNAGKVEFKDALGGRGTEIDVTISYHPPMGAIGIGISKLFNTKFEKLVKEDVRNFKTYIETGKNEKEEEVK